MQTRRCISARAASTATGSARRRRSRIGGLEGGGRSRGKGDGGRGEEPPAVFPPAFHRERLPPASRPPPLSYSLGGNASEIRRSATANLRSAGASISLSTSRCSPERTGSPRMSSRMRNRSGSAALRTAIAT